MIIHDARKFEEFCAVSESDDPYVIATIESVKASAMAARAAAESKDNKETVIELFREFVSDACLMCDAISPRLVRLTELYLIEE